MEKCDDGWFVGEYDTCLSAELFRMSIFGECLEVAFIWGVKIVEKKNFHNFPSFPTKNINIRLQGGGALFSLLGLQYFLFWLNISVPHFILILLVYTDGRATEGNQKKLDFCSISKAQGAMSGYRKWQVVGEDTTCIRVAVPEIPASSACLAKSFSFMEYKSGQCSPSQHFISRLAISS